MNFVEPIWVKQPHLPCCGQVALAAITHQPLEEIFKLVGHKKGTRTKALARVLRMFGFKCGDRCVARPKNKPELAIAQVHTPKRSGWHWVVIHKGKVYDGAFGHPDGTVEWAEGSRITSYLIITTE